MHKRIFIGRRVSRTDRADLGWSFIGLGVLVQCLLCSALTFAAMPPLGTRATQVAEVVLTIAAAMGLLGVVVGIWLVRRYPS